MIKWGSGLLDFGFLLQTTATSLLFDLHLMSIHGEWCICLPQKDNKLYFASKKGADWNYYLWVWQSALRALGESAAGGKAVDSSRAALEGWWGWIFKLEV